MTTFSTEFPVLDTVSRTAFVNFANDWIKGQSNSRLLKDGKQQIVQNDFSIIESPNGERFQIKEVQTDDKFVIGFKFDKPDDLGRTFRTECVLTKGNISSLRIRVRCLTTGAVPPITPKKPVLVRQFIEYGFVAEDGYFPIQFEPHKVVSNDVDKLGEIFRQEKNLFLPSVYVSKLADGSSWVDVEKLARSLSGVAHVFEEGSFSISNEMMGPADGTNPYDGSIGIIIPNRGVVKKFYKRGSFDNKTNMQSAIESWILQYQASLYARIGHDWVDLEEDFAAELRKKAKIENTKQDSVELDEYIANFDSELMAKNDRIKELEDRLDAFIIAREKENSGTGLLDMIPVSIPIQELYQGEAFDRMRRASKRYLDTTPDLSPRDVAVLSSALKANTASGKSYSLHQQLKAAGKGGGNFYLRFEAILSKIGFVKKSEKTHYRLEAIDSGSGLSGQTFAKTSSDSNRAGKNKVSDIVKDFDIKDLDK